MNGFAIVLVLAVVLVTLWAFFGKSEVEPPESEEVVVRRVVFGVLKQTPAVEKVSPATKKVASKKVAINKVVAKKGK